MENLDPPLPKIKHEKMVRFWPSRGFILDLGDRGSLFHFNLSKHKTTVTDIKKISLLGLTREKKKMKTQPFKGLKKEHGIVLRGFKKEFLDHDVQSWFWRMKMFSQPYDASLNPVWPYRD